MRPATIALLLLLLVAVPLFAHHGKDFLVIESPELPHPGTFYLVTAEQFLLRGGVTYRDEPSLLAGVSERLAAEVHVHIDKETHGSTTLEAIAPAVHLRLVDSQSFHGGASAEYEIGRHGVGNTATLRLIGSRDVGDGSFVFNTGLTRAHGEGTRAIYALGYRADMEAARTWGVEAQGTVRRGSGHEILGAFYNQLGERLTVKSGGGAVVGNGTTSPMIRIGIVWKF